MLLSLEELLILLLLEVLGRLLLLLSSSTNIIIIIVVITVISCSTIKNVIILIGEKLNDRAFYFIFFFWKLYLFFEQRGKSRIWNFMVMVLNFLYRLRYEKKLLWQKRFKSIQFCFQWNLIIAGSFGSWIFIFYSNIFWSECLK